VHSFVEPTPDGTALRPTSSGTRQCKALWNILAQSGKRCQALNWYASHPAENVNGVCVSQLFPVAPASAAPDAWPPQPDAVFQPEPAEELADLRFHPAEVTAAMRQQFIPEAAALDQRDPEVQRLLRSLAWRLAECISLHALTTAVMEEHDWDFCAAYCDIIDRVGHDFMVFHPPRMELVRPDLYEPLKAVMNAICEFHDPMLGRLVELAGPDAHVMIVSDHGFQNGTARPTGPSARSCGTAIWACPCSLAPASGRTRRLPARRCSTSPPRCSCRSACRSAAKWRAMCSSMPSSSRRRSRASTPGRTCPTRSTTPACATVFGSGHVDLGTEMLDLAFVPRTKAMSVIVLRSPHLPAWSLPRACRVGGCRRHRHARPGRAAPGGIESAAGAGAAV